MAKSDARGRSKNDHHVRLYSWLTNSDAWRDLSGNGVKALVYIMSFEFGDNNGRIHMSERRLAEGIAVDRKTARKLLKELQEKGLMVCIAPGSFGAKRSPAAQWRLTFKAWPERSQAPTHEWRKWQSKENARVEKFPIEGGKIPHARGREAGTGGEIPPVQSADPQKTANLNVGNTGPLTLATVKGAAPVDLMRATITEWWRLANRKKRLRLAEQHKLQIDELIDFIRGGDLPFPKVCEIRSSLTAERAAA